MTALKFLVNPRSVQFLAKVNTYIFFTEGDESYHDIVPTGDIRMSNILKVYKDNNGVSYNTARLIDNINNNLISYTVSLFIFVT